MSKKKTIIAQVIEAAAPVITETEPCQIMEAVNKQLGRPVNPESVRQKKIAEREAKRAAGELKRGRKVVEGSKRQAVLAARAAKVAAGVALSKGRPVNPDSKRQQMLAAKTATAI